MREKIAAVGTVLNTRETDTHIRMTMEIEDGGHKFRALLKKSTKLPPSALPEVVMVTLPSGKVLWEQHRESREMVFVLARAGERTVVAALGRGPDGKVARVFPLELLLAPARVVLKDEVVLVLKARAARFLGREYDLTPQEVVCQREIARRNAEAFRRAQLIRKQRRSTARASREEKVRAIMSREPYKAYTTDGGPRSGVPVIDGEWESLPNGVKVIRVASIAQDGTPGDPIEYFRVAKEPRKNPRKEYRVDVYPASAKASVAASLVAEPAPFVPKPCGTVYVVKGGKTYAARAYTTMDDLRAARLAGEIPPSTYVTALDRMDGDRYQVDQVRDDGLSMTTVGLCDAQKKTAKAA